MDSRQSLPTEKPAVLSPDCETGRPRQVWVTNKSTLAIKPEHSFYKVGGESRMKTGPS